MSKKRTPKAEMKAKKAAKIARKKKMQKTIGIIAMVLAVALVAGILLVNYFTKPATPENYINTKSNGFQGYGGEKGTVTHLATLEVEDYGTIKLELYGNDAPITVHNFVALADMGFYEGLTFHRIMDGFMMQGGGDVTKEIEPIRGEFTANGVENNLLHNRGAISMARTNVMDSATSQFFIVHEDSESNHYSLDGKYACFGYVVEGMDVVDAIIAATAHTATDGNGGIPAAYQPVIKSLTVEKK